MIYLRFGRMGEGREMISDEIPCASGKQAAVWAAAIAKVQGSFGPDAALTTSWLISKQATRLQVENATKSFFIEITKR